MGRAITSEIYDREGLKPAYVRLNVNGHKLGHDTPLNSLTKEKADQLRKQRDAKREELDEVLAAHPKSMWSRDLDEFMIAYDEFEVTLADGTNSSQASFDSNGCWRTREPWTDFHNISVSV